jgi:hypothetical protein
MVSFLYMHGYTPLYSPFAPGLMLAFLPLLIAVAVWTIIIKGYALWHAARNGQKEWFIALLVINTLGILEVVYLIWFRSNSSHAHSDRSHTPAHPSSPRA